MEGPMEIREHLNSKPSTCTKIMRSRLVRIRDWEQLGETSNYSLSLLAKQSGASVRQLERFFLETRGVSPSKWLNELRQKKALELISNGASVKEAAAKLGFKQASHFSREFKKFHNLPPIEVCARADMSHLDMRSRV